MGKNEVGVFLSLVQSMSCGDQSSLIRLRGIWHVPCFFMSGLSKAGAQIKIRKRFQNPG